jgi:hypothetical protein
MNAFTHSTWIVVWFEVMINFTTAELYSDERTNTATHLCDICLIIKKNIRNVLHSFELYVLHSASLF